MQYELKIRESDATVDATPLDEHGRTSITVGETARDVTVNTITPHRLRVTTDEGGVDLFVARSKDGIWVWSKGRGRLVQDAARLRATRRGADGGVGQSVTPPMPAVVQNIMVEVGQEVDKGQALVVVSAMKMESTLVAPYPGTVQAVNTEVGAKVNPGDILVEIESAPGPASDDDTDGGTDE